MFSFSNKKRLTMVKIIEKNIVELSPEEVIVEIVVLKKILLWEFKTVYRKVHGSVFKYKNKRYKAVCSFLNFQVYNYFNLPLDED